jgi:hypothetical protein
MNMQQSTDLRDYSLIQLQNLTAAEIRHILSQPQASESRIRLMSEVNLGSYPPDTISGSELVSYVLSLLN